MIDEHTRVSLLHLVERSITAERLVAELEAVFAAAGGRPKVLRMDNGPELVSQALQQFCEGKIGLSYIRPGTPWNNGHIESFNNRLRKALTWSHSSRPSLSWAQLRSALCADSAASPAHGAGMRRDTRAKLGDKRCPRACDRCQE
jgi:transposase InsO family protein